MNRDGGKTPGSEGSAKERGRRPPVRFVVGVVLSCALIVGWIVVRAGGEKPRFHHFTGETMATTYSIKIIDKLQRPGARDAMKRAVAGELDLVNMTMSSFNEDSELYRFNKARTTDPFPMSGSALEVIDAALRLSESTGGAYDVTVGPLVRFWGFTERRPLAKMPTEEQIAEVRARIGWDKIVLDLKGGKIRKLRPDIEIDLSSIAKGAAVDRVAVALQVYKHKNYMVEIGGEVRCRGVNRSGVPWRVGIEVPAEGKREIFEVVELTDVSMATSGDYRAFYEIDGRKISHTIDPRTGRPIEHGLASVTVVHEKCMVADGLATALMVLGPKEGFEMAQKEGLRALFITRGPDGALVDRATSGFQKMRESD